MKWCGLLILLSVRERFTKQGAREVNSHVAYDFLSSSLRKFYELHPVIIFLSYHQFDKRIEKEKCHSKYMEKSNKFINRISRTGQSTFAFADIRSVACNSMYNFRKK